MYFAGCTKKDVQKRGELYLEKNEKTGAKKILIAIILIVLTIYVIYTIYLIIINPADTFTIENDVVTQEETVVGYVIRNEKVIQGENYKNGMSQIVTECQRVSKNESIFRYFSNNEEELTQKISELDEKIESAMKEEQEKEENGLPSADIKIRETQIDGKIQEINKQTDMQKIEEYKKEISRLITEKAQIIGELSKSGSYIKKITEERKNYEQQLNSGAEYIKAPMSGIVSYRVDGLEEILTPQSFSEITKEYLKNLELKTGKIVASSEEKGKVVDNFKVYAASIMKSEEALNAKVGDKVSLRLANNEEIESQIAYVGNEENGERIIIFEIDKVTDELINYRKISFNVVWWSYKGLKVPKSAINIDNDKCYIKRIRSGNVQEILVRLVGQNDKYAIIKPYTNEQLKEMGYTEKEIVNYKKVSLHDEILLKFNNT